MATHAPTSNSITPSASSRLATWLDRAATPLGIALFVLLCHLPLLSLHVDHLLARSHYEFLYLLPVGIIALYYHLGRPKDRSAPYLPWATAWIALGILTLAAAIYMWSPWVAAVSLMLNFLAAAYAAGGRRMTTAILPCWVLGLLVIPPPFNLDTELTTALRGIATTWASHVLDSLGILHLTSGNVITLSDRALFVADACSGVNSFFALLAMALFVGLWSRRHPLHIAGLCLLAIPIVLIENVFRIATIAAAAHWLELDLSQGWTHTALGFVLFALSVGLLASTDQLLLFLGPVAGIAPNLYRRLFRSKGKRKRSGRKRSGGDSLQPEVTTNQPSPLPLARPALLATTIFAALLATAGLAQAALFPLKVISGRDYLAANSLDLPEFTEQSLPEQINGWQRTEFAKIERIAEDPFGALSYAWTYEKKNLKATVSLDQPYKSPHDLTACYQGIGWTPLEKQAHTEPGESHPYVTAEFEQSLRGNAYLLYSLHNQKGDTSAYLRQPLKDRFTTKLNPGGPWYQIQTYVPLPSAAHDKLKQDIQALYQTARTQLQRLVKMEDQ